MLETRTQHGYLLIADISGYTSFVAGTELEHAHEILTELLELIVGQLTTVMTISKLEGDAVFVYAPESSISRSETLLELVEVTYMAFRDRLDSVRRRTTCQCNACRSIPSLDLKFIVHHGSYIVQRVKGIHELIGSDVNLIHRLLKNSVSEKTGWRAYMLLTAACLEQLQQLPDGMYRQTETYEYLGEVEVYCADLRQRYKEAAEARRIVISKEEAVLIFEFEYDAPPPIVWDWFNDPAKRNIWGAGVKWKAVDRPGGRTGVGASNHCAHGKGYSIETILDWRPFRYVTTRAVEHEESIVHWETIMFEPLDGGQRTRMTDTMKAEIRGFPNWLIKIVATVMIKYVQKYPASLQSINDHILKSRQIPEMPMGEMASAQLP